MKAFFLSVLAYFVIKLSEIFVIFGHNVISQNIRNFLLRLVGINIAFGSGIDRSFCFMFGQGKISIGKNTRIGINNHFWNYGSIKIGSCCMFAADVVLNNGWHDRNSYEPFSGGLEIQDGCWIGCGAKIIGSLIIGKNSIVGAGAVVVRDVPEAAIVVGSPAKIIGFRDLPKIACRGDICFSTENYEVIVDAQQQRD